MASRFFRKLGKDLAPAFKKLPSNLNTIGRQISNTTKDIGRGLDSVQKFVDGAGQAMPNPLLKIASGAVSGLRDVNRGVGVGGQALRAVSAGDGVQAGNLAMDAFKTGSQGVAKTALAGGQALAFL